MSPEDKALVEPYSAEEIQAIRVDLWPSGNARLGRSPARWLATVDALSRALATAEAARDLLREGLRQSAYMFHSERFPVGSCSAEWLAKCETLQAAIADALVSTAPKTNKIRMKPPPTAPGEPQ